MIVPVAKIQTRRDEDGIWIARSKLLPGCHAHGQDKGEAILNFQEAAKAHLEALREHQDSAPEPNSAANSNRRATSSFVCSSIRS